MFHRQFPETVVSISTLLRIYRLNKISYKQIKRGKKIIDFNSPIVSTTLRTIDSQLTSCQRNATRVVFLDEAVFSPATGPTRAWAHNNQVLTVDESAFNMKTQALIMAVSADRGVDHFRLYPRSVQTHHFLEFLEELALTNEGEPLAVFMDNMRVHHSKLAKARYPGLNIIPIFNVAYCPQFNGIEAVFSMVKAHYKKALLARILSDQRKNPVQLIKEAVATLDPEKIRRCVDHGVNEINL